jgi:hypothetical protein
VSEFNWQLHVWFGKKTDYGNLELSESGSRDSEYYGTVCYHVIVIGDDNTTADVPQCRGRLASTEVNLRAP